MMKIGDRVLVTYCKIPMTGTILACSTWGVVNGHGINENPCYQIRFDEGNIPVWIDGSFVTSFHLTK